jgi:2'-5' RNA ligase superfamily
MTLDLVRVDFALIPGSPLFDAVIMASQAVTDQFCCNANVIDATTFPPHVSLHICAVPRAALRQLTVTLEAVAAAGLPAVIPGGVEPASGGYVMLGVQRTPELMTLHEAILAAAAQARASMNDGDPFGSPYIRNRFNPHISLAKVDCSDQMVAAAIGESALRQHSRTESRALELCDIGENSDRWDVLASFPAAQGSRADDSPADRARG